MATIPAGEFISELVRDITQEAVTASTAPSEASAQAIKADLNSLCEQIVYALTSRREDIITGAYADIERGYTEVAAKSGIDELTFDAQATAAELRGLTRLLGTAMQYRQMPEAKSAVRDTANRKLLETLYGSTGGISGRDLAKRLGVTPETVARKLPYLRSIGLVRSQQVGKTMVNRLTPETQTLVEEMWAEERVAEPVAEPVGMKTWDKTLMPAWADPRSTYRPVPAAKGYYQVINKRAAQISGNTMRIDPTPVRPAYGHRIHDLTVKHEKVAPGTGVTVEVVGVGTEPGIQSMSELVVEEGMVAALCQMNQVAGNDGPTGLFVKFNPNDRRKIVAQLVGLSVDDTA